MVLKVDHELFNTIVNGSAKIFQLSIAEDEIDGNSRSESNGNANTPDIAVTVGSLELYCNG